MVSFSPEDIFYSKMYSLKRALKFYNPILVLGMSEIISSLTENCPMATVFFLFLCHNVQITDFNYEYNGNLRVVHSIVGQ